MALTQVKTLGIADDAVTLAKQAAGTDGQIITYDASGNPVAVGPGTDGQVLTSTGSGSPPAFEDAAASVGGATGADFNDDVKLRFGTGNDLEVYHDGSNSYIKDAGTGQLILLTNSFRLNNAANGENIITAEEDGAVNLFYNDSKKFETTSDGWKSGDSVKGVFGTGDDLKIYHDGSNCIIDSNTGDLLIRNLSGSGAIYLDAKSGERGIKVNTDGAVELYHDNTKQFETQSDGIKVRGAYSATAGAYPCRAWGNIDGDAGTLAFRAEQGCSSITDSGTGLYTVTLDTSSPDTNGSVTTSVRVNSTAAQQWYLIYGVWTAVNQVEIGARLIDNDGDSFAIADCDVCLFSAFR